MDDANADENDQFLDEELVPALVVVGVLLLLFPEPATSATGAVVLSVGLAMWAWNVVQ